MTDEELEVIAQLKARPLWRKLFFRVGDSLSQSFGSVLPVKFEGEWQFYTEDTNESISGATDKWVERSDGNKSFLRIRNAIDLVLGKDHCKEARYLDYIRAKHLVYIREQQNGR